jgi:hypothetical protein
LDKPGDHVQPLRDAKVSEPSVVVSSDYAQEIEAAGGKIERPGEQFTDISDIDAAAEGARLPARASDLNAKTGASSTPAAPVTPAAPLEGAQIDYSHQVSASGFKGSGAENSPRFGVFDAQLPGVSEPVVVKVLKASKGARFDRELEAAIAAGATGIGPKVYGEVIVGEGLRGFAMEKIEGAFPEYLGPASLPEHEQAIGRSQAAEAAQRVTDETVRDVARFQDAILKRGYYYSGEVQGLVTPDGHWRPIDFETIKKLPAEADPEARQEALAEHAEHFQEHIEMLEELAEKNSRQSSQ